MLAVIDRYSGRFWQRLQLALATELRKTQDILEVNTGEAA